MYSELQLALMDIRAVNSFEEPTETKLMGLPIFIMTDQPETCSGCGARSDFYETKKGSIPCQHHTCLGCQMEWLLVEETCA